MRQQRNITVRKDPIPEGRMTPQQIEAFTAWLMPVCLKRLAQQQAEGNDNPQLLIRCDVAV
jgi:hypothetical protein